MNLEKPIVIFGTGRSGTKVFQKVFSYHPNVAWLTALNNYFPAQPFINKLVLKAVDLPVFGNWLRNNINPGEVYSFWNCYCKGFSAPSRDLTACDLQPEAADRIRRVFAKTLSNKRYRLMVKITGWPRMQYMNEMLPGAKFIHLIRDGRAVANSLINYRYWGGWEGPQKWRWGSLPEPLNREWERHNKSPIALAAIQWKILMDAADREIKDFDKKRVMEIRYEDFCSNPKGIFKKVIQFCELKDDTTFEKVIERYQIKDAGYKWKQELTDEQKEILENVLKDDLERYGYKRRDG